LKGHSSLTAVEPRDGTGKWKVLTDGLGERNGLTAVAPPGKSKRLVSYKFKPSQNPLFMSKYIVSGFLLINILVFSACRKEQTQHPQDDAASQALSSQVNPAASHDGEVLTPAGWISKSKTDHIGKGFHLSAEGNRLRKINDATGKVEADYGVIESRAANQPFLPPTVASAKGVVPLGSGWITYTYWSNPSATAINYFNTNWVVPPAPSTSSGQTIFLFNGLQNSDHILQPVLQWGASAAGGGNYWAIANWYVGSNAVYSSLIPVSPGTSLQGLMTLTGGSGTRYNYTSAFIGYPSINLNVTNIPKLYWAAESLEAYGVTRCSDYPNTAKTRLTAIDLRVGGVQAPLSWTAVNSVTDCGQHSTVVTPGTPNGIVDIYY
jgi:hypothetical protein